MDDVVELRLVQSASALSQMARRTSPLASRGARRQISSFCVGGALAAGLVHVGEMQVGPRLESSLPATL